MDGNINTLFGNLATTIRNVSVAVGVFAFMWGAIQYATSGGVHQLEVGRSHEQTCRWRCSAGGNARGHRVQALSAVVEPTSGCASGEGVDTPDYANGRNPYCAPHR
jgi:hypothetical protein